MYILRVETEQGARRYAYGKEAMALKRMRDWAKQPTVKSVTVQPIEPYLQTKEGRQACIRP